MADHLCTQIRDAVVTALTGLSTTAGRVYQNRSYPLGRAQTPGLLIYDLSDVQVQETVTAPRVLTCETQIAVIAVATEPEGAPLDDELDQIRKEVTVAMAALAATKVNGLAHSVHYEGCEKPKPSSGESQKPIGEAAMSWVVRYGYVEGIPDVAA